MGQRKSSRSGLNRTLFWLYEGEGRLPFIFRWVILVLDLLTIILFLWEPFHSWQRAMNHEWAIPLDIFIAIYITLDFFARLYIAKDKFKFFRKLHNIADVFVVLTLVVPFFFQNLAFLRVLRILRIVRAFTFLRRLESVSQYINHHRIVIDRVTNFVVFLFIMSALVYVNQVGREDSNINTQLDALYFTVTSMTTTGYGDVLLVGQGGKVLSIVVMLLGLTLFVRMLQSLIASDEKIDIKCKVCELQGHEADATHCRRCGSHLFVVAEQQEEKPIESEQSKDS
ncbi:ion transporter [Hirschia litorea]|uniref:Ion transporter n=1 Tax=Hirschia litorea TaxID=1199156 RepID=A0ABW2IIW7_9PROT